MEDQEKSKEELISELQELRKKYNATKAFLETSLEDQKILLNTIINNIPSSVFVKDKNYRKLLANNSHISHMQAHLKSIGLNPDIDIIGKTDFEVTSSEKSEEYFVDDQKVVQFGKSIIEKEESGYSHDGEPINQLITKVPLLNYEGNIVGMVGITTNITELRKLTEELKRKNKQLLKSNAEKDKFFSIIAHDLKSPFNSILGFSQMIIDEIKEENYEQIEEYANTIFKNSSLAVDLLMNLMYWAQSQTGRIIYKPENFKLIDCIDEVLLLFDDIAQQKKVSIQKKIPVNIMVSADKAMLSTILRNLISNAIKFTHSEGKILISAENKEEEILISIQDNGVGIPETVLKNMFKIDSSYSTLGTNKEKGTGLGLVISKEFVEQHKGEIWVESQKDKGSTFNFTLPKNQA